MTSDDSVVLDINVQEGVEFDDAQFQLDTPETLMVQQEVLELEKRL